MTDFTVGNERKLILKFTIPMLLGNVFQQFYQIIDSIIVGHSLGKEALAAVGASFPIIFLLISLIIGIASGGTIIISQFYGAKEPEKVRRTIDTMYIFVIIAGIITGGLGMLFSEDIFHLIKLPSEIIPQAKIFMNVYMAGMVFFFLFNGTSSILRGLGDSKTPLYFLIIANVTNIIFVFLFIKVFRWGIAGAAWATVLSQAGAAITIIWYLNRTHDLVKLNTWRLVFDKDIFYKSLKIGLPSGLQQSFVALGMVALVSIVNRFGTNVIAAYSVAGRIDSMASMPAMNFGQALSAFVGQNLGANKPWRVKNGLKATLFMANFIALIITLVSIFLGKWIMGWFTTDQNVINEGYQYLVIVGSFYFTFSSMFVIGGLLRGAGDTLIPMFITLFSLWIIRIPLAVILSSWFGENGIWWSIPAGWICGLTGSYIWYKTGKWKSKVLVKYDD